MNASRYLSYLDLMCCGFGGAVLMFLIVASARPEQHPTDQLLVVRCRTDWEHGASSAAGGAKNGESSSPARAEAGIEYRRAGESAWRRASPRQSAPDRWVFVAPSQAGSGTETIFVWRHPPQGRWEFRPYLIDFPAARRRAVAGPTTSTESTPVPVRLEAQARRLRLSGEAASVLRLPGETGATLVVELE